MARSGSTPATWAHLGLPWDAVISPRSTLAVEGGLRVEFRGCTAVPENSMWFWGVPPMWPASVFLGNLRVRVYIYDPGCRISAASGVNVDP